MLLRERRAECHQVADGRWCHWGMTMLMRVVDSERAKANRVSSGGFTDMVDIYMSRGVVA